jgi:hypothetical protein
MRQTLGKVADIAWLSVFRAIAMFVAVAAMNRMRTSGGQFCGTLPNIERLLPAVTHECLLVYSTSHKGELSSWYV